MPLERRRIRYSGRVQGVGFRATCRWLAGGFELVGYVRNLPDGCVEVLAEGELAEIDRFTAAIQDQMSGFIRSIDEESEPTGFPPLQGFSVRF
jgi:acylphosphatase